jgi:hypothetical protein
MYKRFSIEYSLILCSNTMLHISAAFLESRILHRRQVRNTWLCRHDRGLGLHQTMRLKASLAALLCKDVRFVSKEWARLLVSWKLVFEKIRSSHNQSQAKRIELVIKTLNTLLWWSNQTRLAIICRRRENRTDSSQNMYILRRHLSVCIYTRSKITDNF